jgi:hypothetical protein
MKVHRLILLPNGSPHEDAVVETDTLEPELLDDVARHFKGLRWDSTAPTAAGTLRVVWNGSESGIALGTFFLDAQMFLCTVVAGGFEPEHDDYILKKTGAEWDHAEVVRHLAAGKPSPFARLHDIPDRPLLAGILLPTLPAETYQDIQGVDLIVATLFLQRIQAWRAED